MAQAPVPRLQIPSESVSTVSTSESTAPAVVEEEFASIMEANETEGTNTQEKASKVLTFSSEQASLAWTCDMYNKESNQLDVGWVGHLSIFITTSRRK